MSDEVLKEFLLYQYKVRKLTRKNVKNNYIDGQHLKQRGFEVEIDHKLSIKDSFELGMPEHLCADPLNLQYIPKETNRRKGRRSTQTLAELLENQADNLDIS